MRVKAHWFRAGEAKPAAEVAGAAAFIAFRVAQNMLKNMRRASFDIEAGPAYFDFLAEALAFAIQCACRVAWPRFAEPERMTFATALGRRAADHLADNQAELLGLQPAAQIRAAFIERLNQRFAEYADFGYGPAGPDFGFLRYFASLVEALVPPKDQPWTREQVIAIEGPQAAATIAKAMRGLLDTGPARAPRTRAATTGD